MTRPWNKSYMTPLHISQFDAFSLNLGEIYMDLAEVYIDLAEIYKPLLVKKKAQRMLQIFVLALSVRGMAGTRAWLFPCGGG